MTDRHGFVKASLQKAVRELLKDKHGHVIPQDIGKCPACVARLWVELGKAAPKAWIGEV